LQFQRLLNGQGIRVLLKVVGGTRQPNKQCKNTGIKDDELMGIQNLGSDSANVR